MTESKQARYDRYFMDIAERTAAMSYAEKRKVGCVIVRDNHIIAAGWNGTPHGHSNVCEYKDENGELKTKDTVIHAEANALYWCAKTEIITEGATCYITLSPCKHCALGLIQSGIKRIVYKELYWNDEKTGLDLLRQAGIEVEQIAESDYILLGYKGSGKPGGGVSVIPADNFTFNGRPLKELIGNFIQGDNNENTR